MADLRTLSRALAETFIDQHPQLATDILESAPVPEIIELLQAQSPRRGAQILSRISTALANTVQKQLKPDLIRKIFGAMDPTAAALLLSSLDKENQEIQLGILDAGLARELRELMSYPEGSAGRLMQPRAMSVSARLTVKQVLNRLKRFPTIDISVLVVTDDAGKLMALVNLPICYGLKRRCPSRNL